MNKAGLESWLSNWILQYVGPSDAPQEYQASHPLSDAKVVIEEDESNPGYYSAKFFLKPHYQLEGLTVSLRLVSRMPK
jgi:type VI secretion system protein ImpC